MSTEQDRRRSERLDTILITGLRRRGECDPEEELKTRVTDVSERGLFLETDARLSVGEIVEFYVELPHEAPVPLVGLVRWRKEDDPVGIGVEIAGDCPENEERIRAFFQSLLEKFMPYNLDDPVS